MRHGGMAILLGVAVALVIAPLPLAQTVDAGPQPGLFCTEGEAVHGRLFPDPDRVTDFISFDEAVCGLDVLNERRPDLVEVKEIARSVGWTNLLTQDKDRFPVLAVEVTDETVPDKVGNIVFITAVHGNEKGAREAMLRVIEDLVIDDGIGPSVPDAAGKGLDEVLDEVRFVFVFPNPDGWMHEATEYRHNDACYVSVTCGATSEPGEVGVESQWYVRVNGNGTDLNRQYPTTGVPHPTIPPLSEPEGQGVHQYLQSLQEPTIAGADLHGMLDADNLMFLLQKDTQRDLVEFVQDEAVAQASAEWINGDPDANLWRATGGETVVWGPTIDLLGYSAPGTGGAYIVQDTGLDAAGFTVEMAFSHITFDNYYQGPGQAMNVMHVGGLRALALGFIDYAFSAPASVTLEGDSVVGVVPHPDVVPEGRYDGSDADPNDVFRQLALGGADVTFVDATDAASLAGLTHLVVPGAAHDVVDWAAVEAWTEAGGTLVLTDRAVEHARKLGLADGMTDLEDFTGRVHVDHDTMLTEGLPIDLRTLVDGNPLGYEAGTVPIHCLDGFTGEAAGERITGYDPATGEPTGTCAVVGHGSVGDGTAVVIGALLPPPQQPGPNGVDGYALTPNGARVLLNALGLSYANGASDDANVAATAADDGGNDTPGVPLLLLTVALGLVAVVANRRR